MDPNANLAEQEELLTVDVGANGEADDDRLEELRDALDTWLGNGGFAPDWTKAPNARKYYGR